MKRAQKKLAAKVEKIIQSPAPAESEKVELSVEQADQLYREIRIENRLTDENDEAGLKEGAEVDPRSKQISTPFKRRRRAEFRACPTQ